MKKLTRELLPYHLQKIKKTEFMLELKMNCNQPLPFPLISKSTVSIN